jgi:hypothetical protein
MQNINFVICTDKGKVSFPSVLIFYLNFQKFQSSILVNFYFKESDCPTKFLTSEAKYNVFHLGLMLGEQHCNCMLNGKFRIRPFIVLKLLCTLLKSDFYFHFSFFFPSRYFLVKYIVFPSAVKVGVIH